MKNLKNTKTVFALIALGLLTAAVGQVQAQTSKPGFATAVRVQGTVSYSLGDNKWYPLVPGKYLPPGSAIRTGHNGTVDIILGKSLELPQAKWAPERISQAPDSPVRGMVTYKPSAEQNMVRLIPNTTLAIDRLNTTDTGADTVSDTELDLKEGKIYAGVKKLSGASQYLVKVPNGVAGVRGTWFSLGADGSTAVYESKNGGLLLAHTVHSVPVTIQVNEGQMYVPGDPSSGGGGQPQTVPIPPALSQLLRQTLVQLKTIFVQQVDFAVDNNNTTHASAVSGLGSGGNGGQQPF
jgi:hypothetical protein